MVHIGQESYNVTKRAADPNENVVALSVFRNATLPTTYRHPLVDIRMCLNASIDAPGQTERLANQAALRQHAAEGNVHIRNLVTQHVLRETFGYDEEAVQTQVEALRFLGNAVQEGANVRIVLPGADWRQFINCGDCTIVERYEESGVYVQATARGDLVLADKSDATYDRALGTFTRLWEEDPMVLRSNDEVLDEIDSAIQDVQTMPLPPLSS